jgi:5-methylthioadenosine/S-adenosylhomocysteine deaminase
MAAHGAGMVWSPLSNLLLYGQTARLGAARAAGVPVALGSDWAPSGSKNLLGELQAARLAAPLAGAGDVPDADLVAMATRSPMCPLDRAITDSLWASSSRLKLVSLSLDPWTG